MQDHRMSTRKCVSAVAASVAALLLGVAPIPARAAFIVQALNSVAPIGGTGAFDVVLTDTGGTAQVSGFSVELSVPSGSGVTFTGVDTNTTAAAYLFGTLQSPPFTFSSFPTTDFTVLDASMTPPGFVTLNTNSIFGLEHVTYAWSAGASAGPVAVSIVGGGTVLSDINANPIPITTVNGTITVTNATVPEPTSLLLLAAGIIVVCCLSVNASASGRRTRPVLSGPRDGLSPVHGA
jgi:hypothetical protein